VTGSDTVKHRCLRFVAALAAAFAAGCAPAARVPAEPAASTQEYSSNKIVAEINQLLREPYSDTQAIDVIYATNRVPTGDLSECSDASYGLQPTGKTSYGICRVSVPKRHPVGFLELALNPHSDPHRYFRVLSQVPLDETSLRALLQSRKPADALMFVHGFNVKFGEAVLRSAQLAYDLKFQGPVLLFTWPAGSAGGLDTVMINRTYEANRGNAAVSVGQLSSLFKLLASTGVTIHLMVHSMGHQVVLPALAAAAAKINAPFIRELVLNAPDFPLADLRRMLPAIRPLARRITLYCSYNDNAIAVSEIWNRGRRVGACEQLDGVDVINVGEIDAPTLGVGGLGHGYYASRPILTDIFQLLLGLPVDRRLFMRKSEPNSVENYYLRP
jgi:esterase/lipase superfamily enzyme